MIGDRSLASNYGLPPFNRWLGTGNSICRNPHDRYAVVLYEQDGQEEIRRLLDQGLDLPRGFFGRAHGIAVCSAAPAVYGAGLFPGRIWLCLHVHCRLPQPRDRGVTDAAQPSMAGSRDCFFNSPGPTLIGAW